MFPNRHRQILRSSLPQQICFSAARLGRHWILPPKQTSFELARSCALTTMRPFVKMPPPIRDLTRGELGTKCEPTLRTLAALIGMCTDVI